MYMKRSLKELYRVAKGERIDSRDAASLDSASSKKKGCCVKEAACCDSKCEKDC